MCSKKVQLIQADILGRMYFFTQLGQPVQLKTNVMFNRRICERQTTYAHSSKVHKSISINNCFKLNIIYFNIFSQKILYIKVMCRISYRQFVHMKMDMYVCKSTYMREGFLQLRNLLQGGVLGIRVLQQATYIYLVVQVCVHLHTQSVTLCHTQLLQSTTGYMYQGHDDNIESTGESRQVHLQRETIC